MIIVNTLLDPRVAETLLGGGLAVIKTDTIYGIVARADSPEAMRRLYSVKHRDSLKSCIILATPAQAIPGLNDRQLTHYLQLNQEYPTSVVTPSAQVLPHLPHQQGTLAFRAVPKDSELAKLIRQTGLLLAPSANPKGLPPATNVYEAINYFGNMVDIYVDGGTTTATKPSRIISFDGDRVVIIRE